MANALANKQIRVIGAVNIDICSGLDDFCKICSIFPENEDFSFTVKSEEDVKHSEPLSTNFFGVSAIRNGIIY